MVSADTNLTCCLLLYGREFSLVCFIRSLCYVSLILTSGGKGYLFVKSTRVIKLHCPHENPISKARIYPLSAITSQTLNPTLAVSQYAD